MVVYNYSSLILTDVQLKVKIYHDLFNYYWKFLHRSFEVSEFLLDRQLGIRSLLYKICTDSVLLAAKCFKCFNRFTLKPAVREFLDSLSSMLTIVCLYHFTNFVQYMYRYFTSFNSHITMTQEFEHPFFMQLFAVSHSVKKCFNYFIYFLLVLTSK